MNTQEELVVGARVFVKPTKDQALLLYSGKFGSIAEILAWESNNILVDFDDDSSQLFKPEELQPVPPRPLTFWQATFLRWIVENEIHIRSRWTYADGSEPYTGSPETTHFEIGGPGGFVRITLEEQHGVRDYVVPADWKSGRMWMLTPMGERVLAQAKEWA